MDYLHGDVDDHEFEAALDYELARESDVLREAASERDTLARQRRKFPSRDAMHEATSFTLHAKHECDWIVDYPWVFIWQCRSFPAKPWNQLGERERASILRGFPKPPNEVVPLHMTDVRRLNAMGLFQLLIALAADEAEPSTRPHIRPMVDRRQLSIWNLSRLLDVAREEGKPDDLVQELEAQLKARPSGDTLSEERFLDAVFTLDFGKTKKRLLDEFAAFLDLVENRKRLEKFARKSMSEAACKDHLKYLATLRLRDHLARPENGTAPRRASQVSSEGLLWKVNDFAGANRKRDSSGGPRAFHDARARSGVPAIQAPLYSDLPGLDNAIQRAKLCLKEAPFSLASEPNKPPPKSF